MSSCFCPLHRFLAWPHFVLSISSRFLFCVFLFSVFCFVFSIAFFPFLLFLILLSSFLYFLRPSQMKLFRFHLPLLGLSLNSCSVYIEPLLYDMVFCVFHKCYNNLPGAYFREWFIVCLQ